MAIEMRIYGDGSVRTTVPLTDDEKTDYAPDNQGNLVVELNRNGSIYAHVEGIPGGKCIQLGVHEIRKMVQEEYGQ